ncbi:hypothetical protein ACIBI3_14220 [Actinomadura luteofluorescens]|uniref:hypothetical protein n=1 Tax=Actinomadura luteofluorescens TaxID=46163 RepID=UPI00348256E8
MSDQSGDVLDEAAKLVDALIRRVSGGGRDGRAGRGGEPDEPDEAGEPRGDVWDRAIADEAPGGDAGGPHIATGAPECRDCPVCRAIAMKRESGGDVGRHLREAGRSLFAAALDVAAVFDRTRASDRAQGAHREQRFGRTGPPEASEGARAGTSDRSERPDPGDPWSAATGGPIDIG